MPAPPPPETVETIVRRLDRRAEKDQLAVIRLALTPYELRFEMPSWMAHNVLRGEPLTEDRVKAHRKLAPETSYADYLEGRDRMRRRLLADSKAVNEWLDLYETALDLAREQAERGRDVQDAASRVKAAQDAPSLPGVGQDAEGPADGS